jgi:YfiR/HmsC-like
VAVLARGSRPLDLAPRNLLRLALAVLLAASAVQTTCRAQTDPDAEYRVKAAFLYKFGSFVEWPEQAFPHADTPLAIGVIGADALADELAKIVTGRSLNGRPITVRKLRRGDSVSGLHILFIGRSDESRVADILSAAKGQALLTVTESEDGLEHGSSINFVIVDDKVRFDVALPRPEPGQIKISARLLAVARKVIGKSS